MKDKLIRTAKFAKNLSDIWFPKEAQGRLAQLAQISLRAVATYDLYSQWKEDGGIKNVVKTWEDQGYCFDYLPSLDKDQFKHIFPKTKVIWVNAGREVREFKRGDEFCIMIEADARAPKPETTVAYMRGDWGPALVEFLWDKYPAGMFVHYYDFKLETSVSAYDPPETSLIRSTEEEDELALAELKIRMTLAAGQPRRVLLHGPPGTGKSETAYALMKAQGLKRLCVVDPSSTINLDALKDLDPDAIIIDDFDRMDTRTFFRYLPTMRGPKLVIATVNTLGKLDEALLRAGRFDDIVEIKAPEHSHADRILSYYEGMFKIRLPESGREAALKMTPAFMKELVQSVSILGVRFTDHEVARVLRQAELSNPDDD